MVAVPVDDDGQDQGGQADGFDDGDESVVAEIAHDGAVHAEADEEGDCDYRRAGEKPEMDPQGVVHVVDAKTNDKGEPKRYPDKYHVCSHLDEPFLPARQS